MSDGRTTALQRVGYGVIVAFFAYSALDVLVLRGRTLLDPDVETLTVAHWMSEPGVREGFDEVFRRFEEHKAAEGRKVRVVQSTVPSRGYKQWFVTQLISGRPADVMGMSWETNAAFIRQYFLPLTDYVAAPNPYNDDTPLEGLSWEDSFIDNMESGQVFLGEVTSDYYQVAWSYNIYRLFVNLDLLEAATGSRQTPETLQQWLDACDAIQEYGTRTNRALTPIACRGIDKMTIYAFLRDYFGQMNGHLNDFFVRGGASRADTLDLLLHDPATRERMLASVEVLRQLGQHFGHGFQAIDNEQALFRFFSGDAGFYYTGSFIAGGVLENAPFEVGIIRVPALADDHELSEYFTGPISESGVQGSNKFGVPRASRHRELAVELLQFLTSYEENQVIARHCKFPPIVRQAAFDGVLASFKPFMDGNSLVPIPFEFGGPSTTSSIRLYQDIEAVITEDMRDGGAFVLERLRGRRGMILSELAENIVTYKRMAWVQEGERTRGAVGLLREDLGHAESTRAAEDMRNRAQLQATAALDQYVDLHRLRALVGKL